jgi:hypothetical protein
VPSVKWPVYAVEDRRNYEFNANVTGLSYVEPDLFRAEAMRYWMDNFVTLFGR